ncbi:MAG: SoxR reducing system RseC family protein [Thiobacillaceae bacterium]
MIETTARVTRLQGDTAWVKVEAPTSCGACGGKGCGSALYARLLNPREPEYPVDNPIAAQPGDWVVIGIEDGAILSAAVRGYLLPLALLVIGAVAGSLLGEGAAVVGAGIGLALAWMRLRHGHRAAMPVILRQATGGCGQI